MTQQRIVMRLQAAKKRRTSYVTLSATILVGTAAWLILWLSSGSNLWSLFRLNSRFASKENEDPSDLPYKTRALFASPMIEFSIPESTAKELARHGLERFDSFKNSGELHKVQRTDPRDASIGVTGFVKYQENLRLRAAQSQTQDLDGRLQAMACEYAMKAVRSQFPKESKQYSCWSWFEVYQRGDAVHPEILGHDGAYIAGTTYLGSRCARTQERKSLGADKNALSSEVLYLERRNVVELMDPRGHNPPFGTDFFVPFEKLGVGQLWPSWLPRMVAPSHSRCESVFLWYKIGVMHLPREMRDWSFDWDSCPFERSFAHPEVISPSLQIKS